MRSRHSRRIVPTSHSQNAFACGDRTGVFYTRSPRARLRRGNGRPNCDATGRGLEGYSTIGRLQALRRDAKPISTWPNRDEAFQNVLQGLLNLILDSRREYINTETAIL
jgi:hypothetical protein